MVGDDVSLSGAEDPPLPAPTPPHVGFPQLWGGGWTWRATNGRGAAATPLIAALRPRLAALEGVIAQHGFLVGGRFTVADLNVAGCLTYLRLNQDLLDDVPHVRAWYTAALARPAALAAWALREGR